MANCCTYSIVTPPEPLPQLGTPANLAASDIGETTATVSWDAVNDATSYVVTTMPGGSVQIVTDPTIDLTGLTDGTEYTVSVVARADGFLDSVAASIQFTTEETPQQLATPTGLASTDTTSDAITMEWATVASATGYNLDWRLDGTTPWTTVSVTNTSHEVTGLSANLPYQFRVQATAAGFTPSEYSAIVTVSTALEQLAIPANVTANDVTDDSVRFTWNAVTNATDYHVSLQGPTGGPIEQTVNEVEEASFSGLTAATLYAITVIAQASGFSDSLPGTGQFTTDTV